MNNQWNIDPDQIHQMAFEEGQPADNGDGYLFTSEEFDLFVERLLTAAAPVPPAGDVEVLGYIVETHGHHYYSSKFMGGYGNTCTELVDRAHVTRLTAERDEEALWRKEAREGWGQATKVIEMQRAKLDEQEAELTKARECITKIAMWPDGGNAYGQDKIKAFANRILSGTELHKATEIAHQSAPAAKVCQQPQAHPARCGCEQE